MSTQPLTLLFVCSSLVLSACSAGEGKADSSSPAAPGGDWEELDDGDDKADSGADGGDGTKDEEWPSCGDEVVEGEACEGTVEETVCVDEDGVFWWCDGGVWTADKD